MQIEYAVGSHYASSPEAGARAPALLNHCLRS